MIVVGAITALIITAFALLLVGFAIRLGVDSHALTHVPESRVSSGNI